jgi:SCF-associated factor 1
LGVRPDGDTSRALRYGTVGEDVVDVLEGIPTRPDDVFGQSDWEAWEKGLRARQLEESERVVKIASGLDFVVALKGNGEVWHRKVRTKETCSWQYVSL